MTDPIPARLAALKTTPTPDLKQQWRDLFDSEPPPFNRRYLESRLAYRIQELAYGGLKPETMKRLQELGDEIGTETAPGRRRRQEGLPIVGTRLIREWQGVEHLVTVTAQGFEWQGRPYRCQSALNPAPRSASKFDPPFGEERDPARRSGAGGGDGPGPAPVRR